MKHRGSIYTPIYLWNELVIEIVVNKQANMFCLFSIIMLSVDVQFILTLFLPPSQQQQQQQQHQERVRERTRRGRHQSTIQTVNETDVACAASLPPSLPSHLQNKSRLHPDLIQYHIVQPFSTKCEKS